MYKSVNSGLESVHFYFNLLIADLTRLSYCRSVSVHFIYFVYIPTIRMSIFLFPLKDLLDLVLNFQKLH